MKVYAFGKAVIKTIYNYIYINFNYKYAYAYNVAVYIARHLEFFFQSFVLFENKK